MRALFNSLFSVTKHPVKVIRGALETLRDISSHEDKKALSPLS